VAQLVPDVEDLAVGAGEVDQREAVGAGRGNRLFQKHMLPGLESGGGDLVVEVKLVLPKLLDERSKELLREFGRLNGDDVRQTLMEHKDHE